MGNVLLILHDATCDNYFIVNNCWNQMYQDLCYLLIVSRLINIIYILAWYKKQKWKMQALTLPGYTLYFVKALYFSYFISNYLYYVHLFGIRWSFSIDLFPNVLFRTVDYFWKHVPTRLFISLCWNVLHKI